MKCVHNLIRNRCLRWIARLHVGIKEIKDKLHKINYGTLCVHFDMAGLFGIRKYGVDINGYVMDPVKGLSIWLQKRSPDKQTWPSYWDSMVSGGLSVGYGINETAIKEAGEEAGIPNHLIAKLKSAGCVSFFFESERGLFPNTEFVYDLELPPDFVPNNSDGEVETFELLPVSECLERILSPHFKTTSVPVALDFLIRHGYITAENGKM